MHFTICHSFVIVIFTGNFALWAFNLQELESRNYRIEISNMPIKENQEEFQSALTIKSKYNQAFGCVFPTIKQNTSKEESVTENINKQIQELLQPLSHTCLYHVDGWWTYEFCYRLFVRQYHTRYTETHEMEIVAPIINLGFYNSDFDWDVDIHKEGLQQKNMQFHSQTYINGSKCDITNQARTTEIRFYCKDIPLDHIYQVLEPSSCHYVFYIYTNKLCSISEFSLPSFDGPSKIVCHPILKEPQFSVYQEEKTKTKTTDVEFQSDLQTDIEKLLLIVYEIKDDVFWTYLDKEIETLKNLVRPHKLTAYVSFLKVSILLWQNEMENIFKRVYDKTEAAAEIAKMSATVQDLFAKLDEAERSGYKSPSHSHVKPLSKDKKLVLMSGKSFSSLTEEQQKKIRSIIKAILMGHHEAVLENQREKALARNYKFNWKL